MTNLKALADRVEAATPDQVIGTAVANDEVAMRLGLETLDEDARTRARYLLEYADIISKDMYEGRRPSGIWNLERASKILIDQANLIAALRSSLSNPKGEGDA